MPKLPTEFRTSFTLACECGEEIHGTISTTGFRHLPVSHIDEVNIDFSKAETVVRYENDITACPKCGKPLKMKPELQKGDDEMGGKPQKNTPADKRLKENKPATSKPAPAPMKKGK